ncbi:MAG TPA: hypothetical protein VM531_09055 [Sphingomicrobium sp.]|nr:hypothetical protein [Sphingomicrobium sp.]
MTGIFYYSLNKAPDRQPIKLSGGRVVWIRVEEVDDDLLGALDRAKRRGDESVMNTHTHKLPSN